MEKGSLINTPAIETNYKYASALAVLGSFLAMLGIFLSSDNFEILKRLWKLNADYKVSYRKEIFPYQWKIALSWISGYFIFQLFNPVLFATKGAVVAGQMGMTISALNGVLGLAMSWINTKVPWFSALIAKKDYRELDRFFFKSFRQTISVTVLWLITLYLIVYSLQYYNITIGYRFLSALPLGFMCMSFLANSIVFGMAVYLRCHKAEPLLMQSVVTAILSAISTLVLAKLYGETGVTAGYMFLTLILGVVWVSITFNRKRKLWHQ
jgi:O-antigen/teichoic acid export membrane protein